MNRRRTRISAFWALLSIVFAQVATATYACPLIEASTADSSPRLEMSIPCAEMANDGPTDTSTLCLEHCKVGKQLVDTHPPTDQPSPGPVFAFLVATFLAPASARTLSFEPLLARAAAPPVFASSNRLRI